MGKKFGSYSRDDVIFLLKDISDLVTEQSNIEREKEIQGGKHYSEMLPIEYQVSDIYVNLYKEILDKYKEKLAYSVGIMCEKILKKRGENLVLVSLARAGTPIGVLSRRYMKKVHNIDAMHYSISIIKDKGIDENAIKYIVRNHPNDSIQFIDGWTGKGTIGSVLEEACASLYTKYNIRLDSSLAVLADCAGISTLYGVREDFLIPSACLNSTVSGLISRTVLRDDIIGKDDFHGAKYYKDLEEFDLSNEYVEIIEGQFDSIKEKVIKEIYNWTSDSITRAGREDVNLIKEKYKVEDINFIKPGIGETTRVLLRRVPDKILVKDINDQDLEHILILSKEKGIQVEEFPLKAYKCCGIIKNMKEV